ncbi:MAG: hypothetical protein Q8P57_05395 [Candidatus Pacearchaeota archaeon]|nr:hypothetical protein [Candidatus Pacearchaeota archaeon]
MIEKRLIGLAIVILIIAGAYGVFFNKVGEQGVLFQPACENKKQESTETVSGLSYDTYPVKAEWRIVDGELVEVITLLEGDLEKIKFQEAQIINSREKCGDKAVKKAEALWANSPPQCDKGCHPSRGTESSKPRYGSMGDYECRWEPHSEREINKIRKLHLYCSIDCSVTWTLYCSPDDTAMINQNSEPNAISSIGVD